MTIDWKSGPVSAEAVRAELKAGNRDLQRLIQLREGYDDHISTVAEADPGLAQVMKAVVMRIGGLTARVEADEHEGTVTLPGADFDEDEENARTLSEPGALPSPDSLIITADEVPPAEVSAVTLAPEPEAK